MWLRTVSDRMGNQPKDKLESNDIKRKIWVTALSSHVSLCLLGYECGGVFQVEDKEMDHIMKIRHDRR